MDSETFGYNPLSQLNADQNATASMTASYDDAARVRTVTEGSATTTYG